MLVWRIILKYIERHMKRSNSIHLAHRSPGGSPSFLEIWGDVARVIAADYRIRLVPWQPLWEGDTPGWRYVPQFHEIQIVPNDLCYLNEDAFRGIVFQEIFRALYGQMNLIKEPLDKNAVFVSLFNVMNTPRLVRRGLKVWPGARRWLDKLYSHQYPDVDDAFLRFNMSRLPLHTQFLDASLYEARLDRLDLRITHPKVKDALEESRKLRHEAVATEIDMEFYEILTDIWEGWVKDLTQENLNQRMFEGGGIAMSSS